MNFRAIHAERKLPLCRTMCGVIGNECVRVCVGGKGCRRERGICLCRYSLYRCRRQQMWLEPGTAKSLVCRYNEQHRQGLQSFSVVQQPSLWVDYALCTIGAWGGGARGKPITKWSNGWVCFQQMRCQRYLHRFATLRSEVVNRCVCLSLLPK